MLNRNECELIELLRENDSEQTALVAIKVFAAFLEQLEAAPKPRAAFPQGSS